MLNHEGLSLQQLRQKIPNFNLIICFLFAHTESFDGRDKPSVLVTSPGSPDFNFQQKLQPSTHSKRPLGRYQGRFSQSSSIDPNIGGRMQIKLGFESSALQLILTIVCAADLTFRPNGTARNPYAKVSLMSNRITERHVKNLYLIRYYCFLVTLTNQNVERKH